MAAPATTSLGSVLASGVAADRCAATAPVGGLPGGEGAYGDPRRGPVSTTGGDQAGVGAGGRSNEADAGVRTVRSGLGGPNTRSWPAEKGMSGSGLAVSRARRRRRLTPTTIADTTIRRIAAPDANKTAWYSSTRIGIVGDNAKPAGPALNRLGEPDVPRRHSHHTCRPRGWQRIRPCNTKARRGKPMRQVVCTPTDASRDRRSVPRLWQGDPAGPKNAEPAARRDHVR